MSCSKNEMFSQTLEVDMTGLMSYVVTIHEIFTKTSD